MGMNSSSGSTDPRVDAFVATLTSTWHDEVDVQYAGLKWPMGV